jgi:hypothetical protein
MLNRGNMRGDGRRVLLASVSGLLLLGTLLLVVLGGNGLSSSNNLELVTLPGLKQDVDDALKDAFNPDVIKLSQHIDKSLHTLNNVNLNGVNSAKVLEIIAKAKKAFSQNSDAQDIAMRARIAAAKSDAFLMDAEQSQKIAFARSSDAAKAAATATAEANALRLKLKHASTQYEHSSDAAKQAHSAYLVSRNIAQILKSEADKAEKQSALAEKASAAAAANAVSAKATAAAAADALAVAIKDHSRKMKEHNALDAAFKHALSVRDAAAVAVHKASIAVQITSSSNSAKLHAAQDSAKAAEADLKIKIAAAAVASRELKIAGQIRRAKQSAAVVADAAFLKAQDALKASQSRADESKAAASAAAANSVKAARAAGDALKKLMALKQSELTWPGKKPALSS